MDPIELPYHVPFHPTVQESRIVRHILEKCVPTEIALLIMHLGYSPWLARRRAEAKEYQSLAPEPNIAGIYLSTTTPIPRGFRSNRIIFQTRAADQGWATFGGEGTFNNSHTWFDASILRPLAPRAQENEHMVLEHAMANEWNDIASARDALHERGWTFVVSQDGSITWRVCNNVTAEENHRNYRVEWARGVPTQVENELAEGKGEGFLELLQPGCIVVLWARAEEHLWCNKVSAATIEIELDVP
ncbi:hypothetical protein QQS21_001725 [Conoideocrella luteorostrata]|uniref:Uncharacterized protein n=1 Tax=Conoideocrella luteorostrata TaxID=1105319 RepID=A0AAJ0G1W1_9HYPO|nr:hypothetical protein QQS21_001725 [Conoideocrella luteorostrata]